MAASKDHLNRVDAIVGLSLRILDSMYYEEAHRFCYAIRRGRKKDRPWYRYTAIALLGLEEARRWGLPVSFPLDEICNDLARCSGEEKDLGNKALALWAALKLKADGAEKALSSLLEHGSFIANFEEGLVRSTELAWAVYSLGMAWMDLTAPGGVLPAASKDTVWKRFREAIQALLKNRNRKSGLFQTATKTNGRLSRWEKMKVGSGYFDSQVYGAMALAKAGKALDEANLVKGALETALALVKHQGKSGEWPWHYNITSGTVIDPYPLFSVHQDGMGPMLLLEVGEATGTEFQENVERSLQWVFGQNELNLSMIDRERDMIWRAIKRKGALRFLLQANRLAHYVKMPRVAELLSHMPGRAIVHECRPYHLGWALYAFSRNRPLIRTPDLTASPVLQTSEASPS